MITSSKIPPRYLLRAIFTSALSLHLAALYPLVQLVLKQSNLSPKWITVIGIGGILAALVFLLELGLLLATWFLDQSVWLGWIERGVTRLKRLGKLNWLFFGLGIAVYSFLILSSDTRISGNSALRWYLFGLLALAGAIFLAGSGTSWGNALVMALLVAGGGYKIASFIPNISTYPFSLDWSETSRYWYASLYLSDWLYGFHISPTVLHPSRYLMQAVPFLVLNSPLWLHRLWQVFLWISTTLAASILLARRLSIPDRFRQWAFIIWAGLFLLLGPVYYHLLVPVILVLLGFDVRKSWRSLLVVLIASGWAGISRVNWLPVPGLLAATLYFLETSGSSTIKTSAINLLRYLLWPAIWVIAGTGLAYGIQNAYTLWSGNPKELFGSGLTSQLLWYRLFPNATFPLGVLLNLLLVFLPLSMLIGYCLIADGKEHRSERVAVFSLIRFLGVSAILFVLLAGGLVVSVKIGGGSNLHNLDAFVVVLLVVSSYLFFDKVVFERGEQANSSSAVKNPASENRFHIPWSVLALTLLVPVFFIVNEGGVVNLPKKEVVANSLATIQQAVDQVTQRGDQVLFISERQLAAFGTIRGVAIVPDYEKVFLMEMAMADNQPYLRTFYERLKNHQYALIVSEPLKVLYQDRSSSFNEENNAWVKRVAVPILCYYEATETFKGLRTQLLVPRQTASTIPASQCP